MNTKDESASIELACNIADDVIEYLTDNGLVGNDVIFDESRIDTEEDPSGFTEEGRDLFEHIYNLIRNI